MKGWRTVAFNAAMLVVAAITLLTGEQPEDAEQQVNIFLDNLEALLLAGIPLVNIGLRAVTSTPVFKKD